MARPRTVDRERVLAVYADIGEIRQTARIIGIHEQTVRSILKANRGACRSCGKPAANGKTKCADCARKQRIEAKALQQEHLRQGLCVHCTEPLDHPSRRHCAKHRAASVEGSRAHRRRRMVNTTGTTLEREKELRIWNNYGEGGVTAWKRDQGCCVICGLSYADRAVYLHHIDQNRRNNIPENFACLCYTCHRLIHGFLDHPQLSRLFTWFHANYPEERLTQLLLQKTQPKKRAPRPAPVSDAQTTLAFALTS